jgi:monofunctional biosynthetic peptidoglycan transglycosylase
MAEKKSRIIVQNQSSYGKWLLSGLGLIVISLLISIILLTLAYSWVNPPLTWLMVDRYFKGEKTTLQPINHQWVEIEEISPNVVQAVVAAEDNLFLSHWGFDIKSIKEARSHNRVGKTLRGASTISMQVAKNVFLWHGRTLTRKILEAGFTILIETFWSKQRIMEVYLNIIELGPAIYGIESASNHFFKKSASDLTRNEAALMATVLPNPLFRNPAKPSSYMLRYQQTILKNMKNVGSINFTNNKASQNQPTTTKNKKN